MTLVTLRRAGEIIVEKKLIQPKPDIKLTITKPVKNKNRKTKTNEGAFQLVINEFSKLKKSKEERLSPSAFVVGKLSWKIKTVITKSKNTSNFDFGFFLECNDNQSKLALF